MRPRLLREEDRGVRQEHQRVEQGYGEDDRGDDARRVRHLAAGQQLAELRLERLLLPEHRGEPLVPRALERIHALVPRDGVCGRKLRRCAEHRVQLGLEPLAPGLPAGVPDAHRRADDERGACPHLDRVLQGVLYVDRLRALQRRWAVVVVERVIMPAEAPLESLLTGQLARRARLHAGRGAGRLH